MSRVLRPDQATDPAVAGGKAAALARLTAGGFAPPPFLVVVPGDGAPDLTGFLSGLGPGPYAVRSSARDEDGASLSHAGQFLTELDVPADEVAAAVARVSASGMNGAAARYRAARGAEEAAAPISVVVQQMIAPRAAGVAFSADPVSGRRDLIVISATSGLADSLVSGEIDGETWTVARDGSVAAAPAGAVLSADDARAIARLAEAAEAHFGTPQDIEWAIDGAGLHILQARPITTLPAAGAAKVYDNSNIVESYPGIVGPLTYSFAEHVYARVYRAFVRLLGVREADVRGNADVFDHMLARIDGRVYYDLVNWYRALALLPGFSLNRGYMETMMGVSEPLPADIVARIAPPPASLWRKLRDALRMGRVAVGLIGQAIALGRTRRRFMVRLDRALGSGLDLSTAPLPALAREYRTIEADLLDRWDAPLVNDFLCMIGFGATRNLLIRWLGERGAELHNDVMIGQGDIVSAEPVHRIVGIAAMVRAAGLTDALADHGLSALDAAPAIRDEVAAYLARFGDRCIQELKLESVPLSVDPAPLVSAIVARARAPEAAARAHRAPGWTALFPRRPVRRWLARRLTGWAKARVRDRENLRFERTRIFGQARRVFLAMGRELVAAGRLDCDRDVFFLSLEELLAAAEGGQGDIAAIARRHRDEDAAAAARPDPPERIVTNAVARPAAPVEGGAVRVGTGCSAGRARGAARVITDPHAQSLLPGEILIARSTDPGWIAHFAGAAGIVVERGSLLSHSAIVARELGIPCVVGLKDATRWLATGDPVEIDGATGAVRRIDD